MRFAAFAVFAILAVGLSPRLAHAGTREDVTDGVARCASIRDDRQWLECFYGAAQPMRSQLGLSPAPDSQVRLSQTAPPVRSGGWFSNVLGDHKKVAPQQFGFASPPVELGGNVDHVAARMTDFNFDQSGMFTATLSNGQVWRQVTGDDTHAHWTRLPDKFVYTVSISEGAFGSFNFRIAGLPGVYKVTRLR